MRGAGGRVIGTMDGILNNDQGTKGKEDKWKEKERRDKILSAQHLNSSFL